jgi:hypothetical protein
MSLSQRLTAVEEIEPWSREASPDSRHRKMSFNPVGTWTEATGEEPTIGAFEVPKWKRIRTYLALVLKHMADYSQSRSSSPSSTASSPLVSSSVMPRSSPSSLGRACT